MSIADTLNAVLMDWTKKEQNVGGGGENPVIQPTDMLPGLERPMPWYFSIKQFDRWFENQIKKQLEEEKNSSKKKKTRRRKTAPRR